MKWLKILLGFSAILVAGCAAFFSVTGLGLLFSGAAMSVMIMAGSLEFAKLVAATYLKQKWTELKGFFKWYLVSAVIILMIVTSAGIFGFLSNAFQQQSIKLDQVQREISVWDVKIKSNDDQVKSLTTQLSALQSNQTTIIDKGKINRTLLRSVDNRDKQVSKIQDKISVYQDSTVKYNQYINNIKNTNIGLEKEIGGFRFVAQAFNVELGTVVKFFILLIIFVFDPLAIALIVAFNQMLMFKKRKDDDVSDGVNPQDLMGEVSRVRLSEDDLSKLETFLNRPPKPNDDLKLAADEYEKRMREYVDEHHDDNDEDHSHKNYPHDNEEDDHGAEINERESSFHQAPEFVDKETIISTVTPEKENNFHEEPKKEKIYHKEWPHYELNNNEENEKKNKT
jgi:hypothetical protein